MLTETYDVIVLGLGGMGSATLYHLAKRGLKVCGIDQFEIANDRGSSHGRTRIIRKAYFEDPEYLPLLDRAYELWEELQKECGQELLVPCEMIVAGQPGGEVVSGLDAAYAKYDVPHERMFAFEAKRKYAQFNLPDDFVIYRDPCAGFLRVEDCVRQHAQLAVGRGATLYQNEEVVDWSSNGDDVIIETEHRILRAGKLIVTTGAWIVKEASSLGVDFQLWRKLAFWYDSPDIANYRLDNLPIFFVELDYGSFYGFPALDHWGLKVAEHIHADTIVHPNQIDRQLKEEDEPLILRFLSDVLPDFQPTRTRFSVCMYTKTPDDNFLLDIHPEHGNVVFGCGFSGHGFKLAPLVGEVLSDLAVEGSTRHPIEFLRLNRFRQS